MKEFDGRLIKPDSTQPSVNMLLQILHSGHEFKKERKKEKTTFEVLEDLAPPSGTKVKSEEWIFECEISHIFPQPVIFCNSYL